VPPLPLPDPPELLEPPKPPLDPPELPGLPELLLPPRLPLWPAPAAFCESRLMLLSFCAMVILLRWAASKRMACARNGYLRLLREPAFRSPLSPCPDRDVLLALRFRSWLRDRPTSSDSLNFPLASRRTNRLSPWCGSMSSLLAAKISSWNGSTLEESICHAFWNTRADGIQRLPQVDHFSGARPQYARAIGR